MITVPRANFWQLFTNRRSAKVISREFYCPILFNMRSLILLSAVTLVCISTVVAKDLIVGSSYNARLTWQQKADYMGIPFKNRVKQLFYSDPAQQIIKGIVIREGSQTESEPSVTAGGVGFSYANIRLKSERGSSLDYIVEIYV